MQNSEVKIHTPYIICDDYMYEGLSKIGDKTTIMFNSAENNGNLFWCHRLHEQQRKNNRH